MLSYAKVISRLSRLSVNLHKVPNITGLRGADCLRFKTTDSKDKIGRTATVDECTPKKPNLPKGFSPCDDPNYVCPPACEETCNKRDIIKKPPCDTDKFWKDSYWKHLLAAVLLTGFTIYITTKIGDHPIYDAKKIKKKQKFQKSTLKDPRYSSQIPKEIPYLLIGGGTAAFAAFRSIKSKDPTAKVLVITAEPNLPYMRPPLSKELWFSDEKDSSCNLVFRQWNGGQRSLFYEPQEFYTDVTDLAQLEKGGVSVAMGWKVAKIDADNKIATLEDGYEIKYDKCLIATGATPKNIPVFESASEEVKSKIISFRTVEDYLQLEHNLSQSSVSNIVIIGGGFLGSELAWSLARNLNLNKKVIYQLVKEKSIMAQILPEYLSDWITEKLSSEGINCITNVEVEDYVYKNNKLTLNLTNGRTIAADQIIMAVGVEPNIELSYESGLEVDPKIGGYLVNAELQARKDLWVAGDAACFYDVQLGRRRVEHHDHAVVSGRLAGENMTGAGKPYLHQSMFWSDMGPDIGYEAIGIVDSALPTVGVFAKPDKEEIQENTNEIKAEDVELNSKNENKSLMPKKTKQLTDNVESKSTESSSKKENNELTINSSCDTTDKISDKINEYQKGVIFYLRDNTIVGIVLWNLFNRMSIARQVLAQGIQYEDLNEVAKLFSIHED